MRRGCDERDEEYSDETYGSSFVDGTSWAGRGTGGYRVDSRLPPLLFPMPAHLQDRVRNELLDWNRMQVYVFGNEDVPEDRKAIDVAERLISTARDLSFVFVKPNEDVPFADERRLVILDTVSGIHDVALIEGDEVERLISPPRGSAHDFDLTFQLRYLKKIDRLGEVAIVGIPQEGEIDYRRIQSILRKLVAHDMQGS
jgi:Ni,Fe-hydrogenase maturation factor